MVDPLVNPDRLQSTEYVNRVKQMDPGHRGASRKFSYEIAEVDAERKKRNPTHEFGEDLYERTDEGSEDAPSEAKPAALHDESNENDSDAVDVVV